MKIDFLKSVLTFSPFSWVFRDRLGVVVSALKRFERAPRTRRENREKHLRKGDFFLIFSPPPVLPPETPFFEVFFAIFSASSWGTLKSF